MAKFDAEFNDHRSRQTGVVGKITRKLLKTYFQRFVDH